MAHGAATVPGRWRCAGKSDRPPACLAGDGLHPGLLPRLVLPNVQCRRLRHHRRGCAADSVRVALDARQVSVMSLFPGLQRRDGPNTGVTTFCPDEPYGAKVT